MLRGVMLFLIACILFAWCVVTSPAQGTAHVPEAALRYKLSTLPSYSAELFFTPDGKRVVLLSHFATKQAAVIPIAKAKKLAKALAGLPEVNARLEPLIAVHDVASGNELFPPLTLATLEVQPATVMSAMTAVAVAPNSKVFLTASPKSVKFWDIETGKPVGAKLEMGNVTVTAEFSRDGKKVLTGSNVANSILDVPGFLPKGAARVEIALWDVATGKKLGEPASKAPAGKGKAQGSLIGKAFWAPDEKTFVTASPMPAKGVQFWDSANMQGVGDPLPVKADTLQFSPDGACVFVGVHGASGMPCELSLWDAATRKQIGKSLSAGMREDLSSNQFRSFAVLPDAKRVMICDGAQAQLWDLSVDPPVKKRSLEHALPVYWLAVSRDGKKSATASGTFGRPGEVRVWDLATGTALLRIPHDGLIKAMEFSPDGNSLATVNDRDARMWNIEGKK